MTTIPETVERTIEIEAEPDVVWELLVDDDERSAWFGGPSTLEPVPGGAGEFTDPDGTRRSAVVDEVDHGRRLRWTWWPDGEPDAGSTVDIDLAPVEPSRPGAPAIGTRVTVTETPLAPVAQLTRGAGCALHTPALLGLELAAMARSAAPAIVGR